MKSQTPVQHHTRAVWVAAIGIWVIAALILAGYIGATNKNVARHFGEVWWGPQDAIGGESTSPLDVGAVEAPVPLSCVVVQVRVGIIFANDTAPPRYADEVRCYDSKGKLVRTDRPYPDRAYE